jgi:dihydrofolate reductase
MDRDPKISIVVSIGPNREIGRDNDLLWDIPEDRARFKAITIGHVVIWGRKTFESVLSYIHKAPPGRTNIIVTRDENYKFEECIVVHSFEEALEKAKELEKDEIFLGGGGQIYKQAMEAGIVDKLYLTIVEGDYESDTFFPDYVDAGFKKINVEEHDNGKYKFKFINLQR